MEARRKLLLYNALELIFQSQLEEDYLFDLIEYGITRMQYSPPDPIKYREPGMKYPNGPPKLTLAVFEETVKFGNQLLDIIRERKGK